MYPKLFEIGPVPVYSYGLMLGIAFLTASALFNRQLKQVKLDENIGVTITFLSLIGGLVGSKLFYVLEEWNFGSSKPFSAYITKDVLFSPSGLTFYGGLLLAILFIIIYCKAKKLSVLQIFDLMAAPAAIAYGIARIGCHLSGDGDYGIPVNGTAWEFIGYSYSAGTVPTHAGVYVHPTPVYEFLASLLIFYFLWKKRNQYKTAGIIFAYYLILTGIERVLIEIIRLNPEVIFGLSQAQIISIFMILIGIYLLYDKLNREKDLISAA